MTIFTSSTGKRLTETSKNAYLRVPGAYVDAPSSHELNWEKEITRLMEDFMVPKETIQQIIWEVKAQSNPKDKNSLKYDRAWNKFKAWFNNVA